MKQKFIEWFTKNNNGCSPAMEDDRSFVREMTQHMFEAYQAGVAEGEARCAALAAENAGLKSVCEDRRTFIMNGVQLGYIQVPTVETDPALETIRVAVSPQEPTPATDAFLAEVRAQGVEMAACALDDVNQFNYANMLDELAQKLRKGGAA
ncbi:hypothetical protein [Citrobacter freundii]|uniref:hypothetical protein n=1 Tax=Citrobacter freundii TaxID=546 RepID=UPI0023AEB6A2|nr:hypothetical protein [Citrobacter freundii]